MPALVAPAGMLTLCGTPTIEPFDDVTPMSIACCCGGAIVTVNGAPFVPRRIVRLDGERLIDMTVMVAVADPPPNVAGSVAVMVARPGRSGRTEIEADDETLTSLGTETTSGVSFVIVR